MKRSRRLRARRFQFCWLRPHSSRAAAEGQGIFRRAAAGPFVSPAQPASQPSQPSQPASQPSPFCGRPPNTAPATKIGLWSLLAATMARSACFHGLRVAWVYGRWYFPVQNIEFPDTTISVSSGTTFGSQLVWRKCVTCGIDGSTALTRCPS